MPHTSFDTYEEWNLALPPIPERSVLFALEPVGAGTPWVESLTSYIARLASAYVVFPGGFMNKLLEPLAQGNHSHLLHISEGKKTNLLNASGLRAALAVQFLETLTMRKDLRHLTLLGWFEVLCLRGFLRATGAWCPACYEHWRKQGEIIYDPLLWAIQEVTICVLHQIPLCQHCPNPECARPLPALCWRSRPGYCAYCKEWLGRQLTTMMKSDPALVERQQWIIRNVGALLALSPQVSVSPSRKRIQEALPAIIQQVTQGNISAFARTLNMPQGLVSHWVNGRKIPQLEMLLHICSVVNLALEALLLHDPGLLRPHLGAADEPAVYELRGKWTHVRVSMEQLRQALEKILSANEDPPPTLTKVSGRLQL